MYNRKMITSAQTTEDHCIKWMVCSQIPTEIGKVLGPLLHWNSTANYPHGTGQHLLSFFIHRLELVFHRIP